MEFQVYFYPKNHFVVYRDETLRSHLGTYNLSALPPYGVDERVDDAVARALLDAFATQFWVASLAYKASGENLSAIAKHYEENMIDANLVLNLPYIKPYFEPVRVWEAQGRSIGLSNYVAGSTISMINNLHDNLSKNKGYKKSNNLSNIKNYLSEIQGWVERNGAIAE